VGTKEANTAGLASAQIECLRLDGGAQVDGHVGVQRRMHPTRANYRSTVRKSSGQTSSRMRRSDSVLSDRLAELATAGLVRRTVAPGPPVQVTYVLTESGADLMPVLEQLSRWAADNLVEECRAESAG
jgi:hypothetical protein